MPWQLDSAERLCHQQAAALSSKIKSLVTLRYWWWRRLGLMGLKGADENESLELEGASNSSVTKSCTAITNKLIFPYATDKHQRVMWKVTWHVNNELLCFCSCEYSVWHGRRWGRRRRWGGCRLDWGCSHPVVRGVRGVGDSLQRLVEGETVSWAAKSHRAGAKIPGGSGQPGHSAAGVWHIGGGHRSDQIW